MGAWGLLKFKLLMILTVKFFCQEVLLYFIKLNCKKKNAKLFKISIPKNVSQRYMLDLIRNAVVCLVRPFLFIILLVTSALMESQQKVRQIHDPKTKVIPPKSKRSWKIPIVHLNQPLNMQYPHVFC